MSDLTIPEQREQAVAVIPEGPGALLAAIAAMARDPSVDVGKLNVLMQMQEHLENRQAERAFVEALKGAQADLPQVSRLGTVSLGDNKGSYAFARLEDIDRVLRPIMDRHGLAVSFDRVQREGGGLVVTGTLSHIAGHSKTASFPVPLDTGPGRNNLQAAGSADSYARRYILEGFFNIVRKGKDDDGVAAGKKYITRELADQLRADANELGRPEDEFLRKMFGETVRSFDEIEVGPVYMAVKSTFDGIRRQRTKQRTQETAP